MYLRILKPGETILEVEVRQVTLPSVDGQVTPMEGHDRMLTVLKPGLVTYARSDQPEDAREAVDVGAGLAEVLPHAVTIFMNRAEVISTSAPKHDEVH
jgi:F0F1-type ATP synthase epsilon subunit